MPSKQLTLKSTRLAVRKATVAPDFIGKTILVEDTWDYVTLWLKRSQCSNELFYWEQAKRFFHATELLPKASSCLTAYYYMLNAAKALLVRHSAQFTDQHGTSGESISKSVSLSSEIVTFQRSGVLSALCRCLGEPANGESYSLKDLLYNLAFLHRAYVLTYTSKSDLFTPIKEPIFVRKVGSHEAWFSARIDDPGYANQHTLNKLPQGYVRDDGVRESFTIRRKNRFDWFRGAAHDAKNLARLGNYHRTVRKYVQYIDGTERLWYLKRGPGPEGIIDRSPLAITFAVMHRLSELARYDPMRLNRHFDSHHNWLLSEFIATAPKQFLDEVSAEITGQEFMPPGRRAIAKHTSG